MVVFPALSLVLSAVPEEPFAPEIGISEWDGVRIERNAGELEPVMLIAHNQARNEFGVQPLIWDKDLAEAAAAYAKRLAYGWPFSHDLQRGVRLRQGENLFKGTRGAFTLTAMAKFWVDERQWFQNGRFPHVVTDGPWQRVGHFTQIVWPTTQRVGCALASSADEDFLVCRYWPAGNQSGVAI
jgi:hypothetical protein